MEIACVSSRQVSEAASHTDQTCEFKTMEQGILLEKKKGMESIMNISELML